FDHLKRCCFRMSRLLCSFSDTNVASECSNFGLLTLLLIMLIRGDGISHFESYSSRYKPMKRLDCIWEGNGANSHASRTQLRLSVASRVAAIHRWASATRPRAWKYARHNHPRVCIGGIMKSGLAGSLPRKDRGWHYRHYGH